MRKSVESGDCGSREQVRTLAIGGVERVKQNTWYRTVLAGKRLIICGWDYERFNHDTKIDFVQG